MTIHLLQADICGFALLICSFQDMASVPLTGPSARSGTNALSPTAFSPSSARPAPPPGERLSFEDLPSSSPFPPPPYASLSSRMRVPAGPSGVEYVLINKSFLNPEQQTVAHEMTQVITLQPP